MPRDRHSIPATDYRAEIVVAFFLFLSIKKSNAERGRKWKKEEKKSNKFLANRIDRKESRNIERERERELRRAGIIQKFILRPGNYELEILDVE